ncbi:MAG: heme exporter protein CcmD [Spongiibacter sp.]|nr:heme exporter protein CcmD [Spongiibacter sp.]
MYFESVEALLYMDGHGSYVWFCFALTFAVLVGLIVQARRRNSTARQLLASAARRRRAEQRSPQ